MCLQVGLESGFRSCRSVFGCRSHFFDSFGCGFHRGRATTGRLGSTAGGFRSATGGLGLTARLTARSTAVVVMAEQAKQTSLGLNGHAEHSQCGDGGKQFATHLQFSN